MIAYRLPRASRGCLWNVTERVPFIPAEEQILERRDTLLEQIQDTIDPEREIVRYIIRGGTL